MRALVGGIQRFSIEDGPGIRSTVFLKGCPLACRWCHNPELIRRENQLMYNAGRCIGCGECVKVCPNQAISFHEGGFQYDESRCSRCLVCVESCCTAALHAAAKPMTVEEIMEIVLRDRGYYEKTGGGVTFSGGECTRHHDFLTELIQRAQAEKIHATIDTSGFCRPEHMAALARKADLLLYDLKCMDDALHRQLTNVSNHLILSNLRSLSQDESIRNKIRVRMPLIGGLNDAPELMESALTFLGECGLGAVDLLPYHLLGVSKYKSMLLDYSVFEPPGRQRLEEIASSFKEKGVCVSILGI